jgi:methionyl-tRNA formyltransferase
VKVAAERMGIPIWPLTLVKDPGFAARLRAEGVDLIIKVQSQCAIHQDVLRSPAVGAFSLHPGPWPEYAGPNAVSWALYNGEATHATTLHWMQTSVDAGPIAYTSKFEVTEVDTALTLSAKCVNLGLPLIEQLLRDAATGSIPRTGEELVARRHHTDAPPQNGYVNWIRHAGGRLGRTPRHTSVIWSSRSQRPG